MSAFVYNICICIVWADNILVRFVYFNNFDGFSITTAKSWCSFLIMYLLIFVFFVFIYFFCNFFFIFLLCILFLITLLLAYSIYQFIPKKKNNYCKIITKLTSMGFAKICKTRLLFQLYIQMVLFIIFLISLLKIIFLWSITKINMHKKGNFLDL